MPKKRKVTSESPINIARFRRSDRYSGYDADDERDDDCSEQQQQIRGNKKNKTVDSDNDSVLGVDDDSAIGNYEQEASGIDEDPIFDDSSASEYGSSIKKSATVKMHQNCVCSLSKNTSGGRYSPVTASGFSDKIQELYKDVINFRRGSIEISSTTVCKKNDYPPLICISVGCPNGMLEMLTRGTHMLNTSLCDKYLLVHVSEYDQYVEEFKTLEIQGIKIQGINICCWKHSGGRVGFGQSRRAAQCLGATLERDRILLCDDTVLGDTDLIAKMRNVDNILIGGRTSGDRLKIDKDKAMKFSLNRPIEQMVSVKRSVRYKGAFMYGKEDVMLYKESEADAMRIEDYDIEKCEAEEKKTGEYEVLMKNQVAELQQLVDAKYLFAKRVKSQLESTCNLSKILKEFYNCNYDAMMYGRAVCSILAEYKVKSEHIRPYNNE